MKTYRVGVVGMGFGRRVHAPGFFGHPRFELVAVAGARPGTADALAAASGARAYDDWQSLVAEADVDVVSIATAPYMHAPVALAAIGRGRNILLEKPTALDAREAGCVVEAARAGGVTGALVHEFRFRPARLAVKERIDRGDIGRLLAFHVTSHMAALAGLSEAPVGWLARAETGGGFLGAIASHYIDTVQWWAGEEVVRVWADLRAAAPYRPAAGGGRERVSAEDSFVVVLTLASGAVATVSVSLAGAGFGERFEVLGDRGAMRVEDDRTVSFVAAGSREPQSVAIEELPPPPHIGTDAPDPRTPPFLRLLDRFAVALDGDAPADLPDLAQGLRIQRILDGARLASATGAAVRLLP